jgi:hypothetical protein
MDLISPERILEPETIHDPGFSDWSPRTCCPMSSVTFWISTRIPSLVNVFISSSSICPEDDDFVSTTLTVDLLAPAMALANGSAESTSLRLHGTMIVFGGCGGSPLSVAWCGLTMSSGTEVVRHR